MELHLARAKGAVSGTIEITGSKSESNRLLILQALYPDISIENLSESDDTTAMKLALDSPEGLIDIHHAGTAMRFLTAYFASREGVAVTLTGSERMQQRPIQLLVDALRSLGADLEYTENEGCPPLKIRGRRLDNNRVVLKANVSSQYISALMLIAPSLPRGLDITLEGQITSAPYISMTLSLLEQAGIKGKFEKQKIVIEPKKAVPPVKIIVESDWSSASYFYSIAALCEEAEIVLTSFKKISTQGDSAIAKIYERFGVQTSFSGNRILLKKVPVKKPKSVQLDLTNSPDLAQTIAVTCFGMGIACELQGLHTLKIKETDRLEALRNELEKLGGKVEITSDSIRLQPAEEIKENVAISTYNDHRMAMAFAPLALRVPIAILDAEVVSKSYPTYWEDLETLGIAGKHRS